MKYILLILSAFILIENSYSQWIMLNSSTSSNLSSVCFVNNSTGFVAGDNGLIIKTTNGGINWTPLNSGLTENINSINFFSNNSGAACANSGIIIFTTNGGASWSNAASGVTDNLFSISFSNNQGICTGSGGTILYSSNGGGSWTIAQSGFIGGFFGAFMFSQSVGYACGVNGIFQPLAGRTTNGGVNWNFTAFYLNTNEGNLRDMHFISSSDGFAASNVFNGQGGISRTIDGGLNWNTQLFPQLLNGLDFAGMNTGYAVGNAGYIIKTTDGGINWISQNSGAGNYLAGVDFTDSLTGYAVGDAGVILKTTTGGITSVQQISNTIPLEFRLEQNYPNPFNPKTIIGYYLSADSFIKLTIYDVLGSEVAELINQKQKAGSYKVEFDASNFPGGIYFYKLNADHFSKVRKMTLLK